MHTASEGRQVTGAISEGSQLTHAASEGHPAMFTGPDDRQVTEPAFTGKVAILSAR